jgi:hypothetical protein
MKILFFRIGESFFDRVSSAAHSRIRSDLSCYTKCVAILRQHGHTYAAFADHHFHGCSHLEMGIIGPVLGHGRDASGSSLDDSVCRLMCLLC